MNSQREQPRVIFFVSSFPASSSGVLHSQVLSMVRFLSEQGFECLFIGSDVSVDKALASTKYIYEKYGVKAKILGIIHGKLGYPGFMLTARNLYKASKDVIKSFRPTHIYSRSIIDSPIARKIAKETGAIAIYDARAVISEEVKFRRGGRSLKYWYIRWVEMHEIDKATRLSCVSKRLKKYINSQGRKYDIRIVPSCLNNKNFYFSQSVRIEVRETYGLLKNHKLLCYSGGLAPWQRITDIIALFEKISMLDSTFRFLFVTPDKWRIKKMLEQSLLKTERYFVESCAQQDVYKYLSAADAGVIMREDIIVNNVSSPIKIGEYLSCGLPVIMTRGIGDFSELIPEAGVGMLLNNSLEDDAIKVVSFLKNLNVESVRNQAISFSYKYYNFKSYISEYKNLYS